MRARGLRNVVASVLVPVVAVFAMVLIARSTWWPLLVGAGGLAVLIVLGRLLYIRVNRKRAQSGLTEDQLKLLREVAEREARRLDISDPWRRVVKVIEDSVRSGLLRFAAPDYMRQGKRARVLLGIAPEPDAQRELSRRFEEADALAATMADLLAGNNTGSKIEISPVMAVECRGDGFTVTPLSAKVQVVTNGALWEFDVLAQSSGLRTLLLLVSIDLSASGIPNLRRSLPAVEHKIKVEFNLLYSAGIFWIHNWQWVLATFIGLGGAIIAWLKLLGL